MGIHSFVCSSFRKKCAVIKVAVAHKAPPSSGEQNNKCPRQELNLVLDLRRVVCESGTPQGRFFSASPRSRTPSCSFERCRAIWHTRKATCFSQYPDLDSNQGPDLRRVRCNPLHHRDSMYQEPTTGFAPVLACLQDRRLSMSSHVGKHECEESNPVGRFWRPLALPGAHSCVGEDPRGLFPWIFTPITSPAGRSNTSR